MATAKKSTSAKKGLPVKLLRDNKRLLQTIEFLFDVETATYTSHPSIRNQAKKFREEAEALLRSSRPAKKGA